MNSGSHLWIREMQLSPCAEWAPSGQGWVYLRISKGQAYWLRHPVAQEINSGVMLILAPAAKGVLRASQLSEVKFHYFEFYPELLSGFLTVYERHHLQMLANEQQADARVIEVGEALNTNFAALITQYRTNNSLLQRCRTLELAALVFASGGVHEQEYPSPRCASARARFQQLLQQMPDAELTRHTPHELADLCGCSLRHFSRLFRETFGISILSKQTELRLEKARQLLKHTDAKVINVAADCGYRHLSLFNMMFKRYFGMTPTQWRRTHSGPGEAQLTVPRTEIKARYSETAVPAETPG